MRGRLRIAMVARDNLKAAGSAALRCGLEGRTTILMLVPEVRWVEEGQLVCELDASALVERLLQQTVSVNNAEAAFVKSRQNHEIQESQNRSDIAAAQQKLKFAEQDLRRFEEGDRASLHQKSQQAIDLATEVEARRELERVELQAKARLVDFAAYLRSSEAEIGL